MNNIIDVSDDMVQLRPAIFNVTVGSSKIKKTLIIASFITLLLSITAILLVNFSNTNANTPLTGKLIKSSSNASKATPGGSNTNKSDNQSVISASTESKPQGDVIPNCSTVSKPQVSAPAISLNSPGLFIGDPVVAHYQIYGNTKEQIYNQISTCSPVSINGERFAASTDYSISWIFDSSVTDQGLCKIQSVSVGVRNAYVMPSWQKTNSSSNQIIESWNGFITHLSEHEYGHARINQDYARKIYTELQSMPSTNCSRINDLGNAKAYAILDELNNANIQYDSSTNHGENQGALL